eukprot:3515950-Amphidinium_carterae.1
MRSGTLAREFAPERRKSTTRRVLVDPSSFSFEIQANFEIEPPLNISPASWTGSPGHRSRDPPNV